MSRLPILIILAAALCCTSSAANESQPTASIYRNLFSEYLGKSEAEIDAKIDDAFQQFFYGADSNERLCYPVEGEVEADDVDPGFAEDGKQAIVGVLRDQLEDPLDGETARLGHTRGLDLRDRDRDVWVESRPRRGDRVDRDRSVVGQAVGEAIGGGPLGHGGEEVSTRRTEVRATRR